jgi:hypothetical protein
MSIPKNVRVSDRSDLADTKRSDFTKRRPEISAKQIYSICLALLVIIVGVALLVYNDALVGSGLCVVVGAVLWFFARHLERSQKKLQATEFLNAMFASVLAAGSKFAIIVKTDGEIVYLDCGFQDMFADLMKEPKRSLDMLCERYQVSPEHRQALLDVISRGHETRIPFVIKGGEEQKVHSLVVQCTPVPRPSGFFMLRGISA